MRKCTLKYIVGDTWFEMLDLFIFVYSEFFHMQLELICEVFFLIQNPSFVHDFWRLRHAILYFKKLLPTRMTPRSCKAHDVNLAGMKKWHHAMRVSNPNRLIDIGEVQSVAFEHEIWDLDRESWRKWDQYVWTPLHVQTMGCFGRRWGLYSVFYDATLNILSRSTVWYSKLLRLNTTPAPLHFGFCWSSSATRRFGVLSKQKSMNLSRHETKPVPEFDITKMNHSPLLQSLYAETLRLVVAVAII